MLTRSLPGRIAIGGVLAAFGTGCGASAATAPAVQVAGPVAAAPARIAATARSSARGIDALTGVARRRYAIEARGAVAHTTLRRVARDPGLLKTVRSGRLSATRAYAKQQFAAVWYHWHVSRVRILKGSQVVVDTGVPFVVAAAKTALRSTSGRRLATLEVSIQDVIGFVRYMHRNHGVDVVVRGQQPGHVRSSPAAAANATLPSHGSVTIGGRRYLTRSFHETAMGGEPLTIWILKRG